MWKLDQVAYVVRSVEASLLAYQALFGPFDVAEYPLDDCRLKVATNNDGPLEIELIEGMEGVTPHSEHIDKHGEGLHHVRFRVDDIDARIAKMEADDAGRIIDLLEMPAGPGAK